MSADRPAPQRTIATVPLLTLPANYAADLDARFDLDPELLAAVREHGLMYDEDDSGSYLQLATEVLGDRVFFAVVQRLGGYDGHGLVDAPVRMAAQRRARLAAAGGPGPAGPAVSPSGAGRA